MNRFFYFVLLFIVPFLANAQAEKDTTHTLDEVVIQENRFQIPFSESSRNISLITKEKIQSAPVQSIPEVLSYVGGVDIRNRGMFGTTADIGIRGGTFEQTLILLNGIKMSDPQTGHHNLSLPLDFMNISQIEVLKGAGARTYGQNALAGVVNIRTEIADERKVYLRLYGGDFKTYGIGFGQSLPHKKYAQQFYVSRDASAGFRHNTDFVNHSLYYQSALKTKNGAINLIASHSGRKFGANGFYASPKFTEQYEEVSTSLVSVNYDFKVGNWRILPRVYWRRGEDLYAFIRNNPNQFRNLHVTQSFGAEFHANLKTKIGNTGFGIENRNENVQSNNLGHHERSNFGVFAEQLFNITQNFNLTAGLYTNYFSDYGWQAYPGLDLGYQLNKQIRLYASVGRAYRIPTYTDLYYKDRATLGNENLSPEKSWSYEAGFKYRREGVSATASYYLRQDESLIDYLYNTTSEKWKATNITKVNTSGTEVSLDFDFRTLLSPSSVLNNIMVSYNYIDAQLDLGENIKTRYTLENFNHQLIIGVNHKIWKNISHQIKARYLDRVTMPDYWVLDSRIAWQKQGKSVFIEATNITNTKYREVLVQMPERWFKAGVHWNFGL